MSKPPPPRASVSSTPPPTSRKVAVSSDSASALHKHRLLFPHEHITNVVSSRGSTVSEPSVHRGSLAQARQASFLSRKPDSESLSLSEQVADPTVDWNERLCQLLSTNKDSQGTNGRRPSLEEQRENILKKKRAQNVKFCLDQVAVKCRTANINGAVLSKPTPMVGEQQRSHNNNNNDNKVDGVANNLTSGVDRATIKRILTFDFLWSDMLFLVETMFHHGMLNPKTCLTDYVFTETAKVPYWAMGQVAVLKVMRRFVTGAILDQIIIRDTADLRALKWYLGLNDEEHIMGMRFDTQALMLQFLQQLEDSHTRSPRDIVHHLFQRVRMEHVTAACQYLKRCLQLIGERNRNADADHSDDHSDAGKLRTGPHVAKIKLLQDLIHTCKRSPYLCQAARLHLVGDCEMHIVNLAPLHQQQTASKTILRKSVSDTTPIADKSLGEESRVSDKRATRGVVVAQPPGKRLIRSPRWFARKSKHVSMEDVTSKVQQVSSSLTDTEISDAEQHDNKQRRGQTATDQQNSNNKMKLADMLSQSCPRETKDEAGGKPLSRGQAHPHLVELQHSLQDSLKDKPNLNQPTPSRELLVAVAQRQIQQQTQHPQQAADDHQMR